MLSVVLGLLITIQPTFANWYVLSAIISQYGVWANISTPTTRPYMELVDNSYQYNHVTLNSDSWIQTGWALGATYSEPYSYVEVCITHCTGDPRFYREYTTHILGTKRDYIVEYTPNTGNIWCAYIDGAQKECRAITSAPESVSAASEVVATSQNTIYTIFQDVRFKNSSNVWQLFDSSWPVKGECPYVGRGNSANFYSLRGSCAYMPMMVHP